MQTTCAGPLSSLAQHGDFHQLTTWGGAGAAPISRSSSSVLLQLLCAEGKQWLPREMKQLLLSEGG